MASCSGTFCWNFVDDDVIFCDECTNPSKECSCAGCQKYLYNEKSTDSEN